VDWLKLRSFASVGGTQDERASLSVMKYGVASVRLRIAQPRTDTHRICFWVSGRQVCNRQKQRMGRRRVPFEEAGQSACRSIRNSYGTFQSRA
jgi:hypothetical protein